MPSVEIVTVKIISQANVALYITFTFCTFTFYCRYNVSAKIEHNDRKDMYTTGLTMSASQT